MKFKFTWAHGIIVALTCFIIFIGYLVLSIEFSNNAFDLVTDDYYTEEINYQKEIDAVNNAANLKERPSIENTKEGIKITFPKDYNASNTKGRFRLLRPNTKQLDINKDFLDLDGTVNEIIIPSQVLKVGNYELRIYWTRDNKDYQMEIPIIWKG